MSWLLYGAYGYTGKLILEQVLAEGGERPILAGRREAPTRELAERHGLEWRQFTLGEDRGRVERGLDGVEAVLHCAGPFSATSKPMVEACLARQVHYLDITGELAVIEDVLQASPRAKAAGVALLPGVGFDVVPSDCLAATLAASLPEAVRLELAFRSDGAASRGTTKSMIESLPEGGCIRKDGKLTTVRPGHRTRVVPFRRGARRCVAIPWGDVSSAYYSTQIPNITVYMAQPEAVIAGMRLMSLVRPVLGSKLVQRGLKRVADRIQGPDSATRQAGRVELWGRVEDRWGDAREAQLEVREGYRFTVDASLACLERVLAGAVAPGSWTPSMAFGADFVLGLPETELTPPARPGSTL
ncbi:MAG: saccharopine dehydrogenase NADP-binding domain-containing protein [Planctomycetes bacterium]|nr:saccharopine dehydrogenase NADP-binding domain-containing protein [Planctomycetota bacterium]